MTHVISIQIKCLIKATIYLLFFIRAIFFLTFIFPIILRLRSGTFDFGVSYYLVCFVIFAIDSRVCSLIFHKAICFHFEFNFLNKLTHFLFLYIYTLVLLESFDLLAFLVCATSRLLIRVHKHEISNIQTTICYVGFFLSISIFVAVLFSYCYDYPLEIY